VGALYADAGKDARAPVRRLMTLSRRHFIGLAIGTAALAGQKTVDAFQRSSRPNSSSPIPIDRKALVTRHNPILQKLDPLSPLSIGNGEFAFTADITGLQTFPEEYERSMPLCTMSQWGWHATALPSGLDPKTLRLTQYNTHGRLVGYHTSSEGQTELFNWLRENPHRLHLGQIGLLLSQGDSPARPSDISDIEQELDLWTGTLNSRFRLAGDQITVRTAVHPDYDLLAVEITSSLTRRGQPSGPDVRIAFPYGSPEMNAADWTRERNHQSNVIAKTAQSVRLHRKLEIDEYYVEIEWDGEATFEAAGNHTFVLSSGISQKRLSFVVGFSPQPAVSSLPGASATFAAAANHWRRIWTDGGAIDFSESSDPRAAELERRVVLSQYLAAIQCSGSMPPQETGLTVNSWYGKFHLEMHWWHAAHFALWNRLPLLEKSLGWYASILPAARELARSQGYRGARWPKMVGPEGRDSPSPVGPLLIWQQPHPIFYAELCYLSHPNRATLARYREIVFESAEFMTSYAYFENSRQRYVLGPPVIPAQENHPARDTWNPTFELAYWSFGLRVAQHWRERLEMKRNPEWDRIVDRLSALPARYGVYLAHENCPQTFTERNYDHPSMLGAFGMLAGDRVNQETMRRTLKKVIAEWQWDKTWGWDYPLTAMTAARLQETKIAVDALMMNTEKNRYLANGHNYQRANLPCYLPGNGGLLYAIAMMAGGWTGAPGINAPGFPNDGSWKVRAENLNVPLLKVV
jgi:protein-glucosylgalactosylhydroxylysine glucosidase